MISSFYRISIHFKFVVVIVVVCSVALHILMSIKASSNITSKNRKLEIVWLLLLSFEY